MQIIITIPDAFVAQLAAAIRMANADIDPATTDDEVIKAGAIRGMYSPARRHAIAMIDGTVKEVAETAVRVAEGQRAEAQRTIDDASSSAVDALDAAFAAIT